MKYTDALFDSRKIFWKKAQDLWGKKEYANYGNYIF